MKRYGRFFVITCLIILVFTQVVGAQYKANPKSAEAIVIADNIIAWQTDSGGWNKNVDYSKVMYQPGASKGITNSAGQVLGTFDNNASIDEMRFLADIYQETAIEKYKDSFMRGLEWILQAQYPSGGWPQYYPLRGGYSDNVTFNDNAMIRVLEFIQEMLDQTRKYGFIDDEYRTRLQEAYVKGIDFILNAQIEVNGHLTVWCQQHDPITYEPTMGRDYEHPSAVSSESVFVVRFLMSLRDQTEAVRIATLSAIEWFELSQLPDGRWARFYDIESNVPIFSGRDGIIRYSVEDIEAERRTGYSWYNNAATNQIFLILSLRKNILTDLRANLLDYQPLTIDVFTDPAIPVFKSPKVMPVETVTGNLQLDIAFTMRNPENLSQITIIINDLEIYSTNELEIKLDYDTTQLNNGPHKLIVKTMTKDDVGLVQSVAFNVNN